MSATTYSVPGAPPVIETPAPIEVPPSLPPEVETPPVPVEMPVETPIQPAVF